MGAEKTDLATDEIENQKAGGKDIVHLLEHLPIQLCSARVASSLPPIHKLFLYSLNSFPIWLIPTFRKPSAVTILATAGSTTG